jgi:hypothetical protein
VQSEAKASRDFRLCHSERSSQFLEKGVRVLKILIKLLVIVKLHA